MDKVRLIPFGDKIGVQILGKNLKLYERSSMSVESEGNKVILYSGNEIIASALTTDYINPKEASVKDLILEIEGMLVTVPNTDLTLSQIQAIQDANNPSSTNVFATIEDLLAENISFSPHESITSTNVQDAMEQLINRTTPSFFMGWQDFADSNTSEADPITQDDITGGEVQLTNNNNDTLTDGNTNVNGETTLNGVNDLWSTISNTFVFKDTGINKNDILSARIHLNISASIINQDFSLRFDFYDQEDGTGNLVFSLRKQVSTETLSAGVFRERIVNVDFFIGQSILNGSAKCFLVGTKSFEVEVIGFNIRIFKIDR